MSDMVSPFSASFFPFSLAYLKCYRNDSERFSQPFIRGAVLPAEDDDAAAVRQGEHAAAGPGSGRSAAHLELLPLSKEK